MRATLHAITNERFQCGRCLTRYRGRADAEQMTARVRLGMACEEIRAEPIHHITSASGQREISFATCIGNLYRPGIVRWAEAYALYERGILPFPGPLMDQPNKVIEIFRVIENHRQAQADRAARKPGGGSHPDPRRVAHG